MLNQNLATKLSSDDRLDWQTFATLAANPTIAIRVRNDELVSLIHQLCKLFLRVTDSFLF